MDFTTLERVSDSYMSDDLRSRRDDLVWRVRWGMDWLSLHLPRPCHILCHITDQPVSLQVSGAGDAVRIQEMYDRRRQDVF